MKTHTHFWKPLALTAGLLLTTLPRAGFSEDKSLPAPAQPSAGESHKTAPSDMVVPALEQNTGMTTKDDGSHVFAFDTASGQGHGHIYIWDHGDSGNSPAVVSGDPSFRESTTLDQQNLTFLRDLYGQLKEMWKEHCTPQQAALLSKLNAAMGSEGRKVF